MKFLHVDDKGVAVPAYKSLSRCALGEGLCLGSDGISAWVDIINKTLFIRKGETEKSFVFAFIPTVIFRIEDGWLELGSDQGIFKFDYERESLELIIRLPDDIDPEFRSNDGCLIDDVYILGFMHRTESSKRLGSIWGFRRGAWFKIDGSISIPNTFVVSSTRTILISDSLTGDIWSYEFDQHWNLIEKTVFVTVTKGAPDGGVIIGNSLVLAIWDGYCVSSFDLETKDRQDYPVPVIRPTNCKYNEEEKTLWLTSAYEGLGDNAKKVSESGKTFSFEVSG